MTSAVINIIADAKRFEKVRYNQRCVAEYEEMWFMTSFRERKNEIFITDRLDKRQTYIYI